jgi:hypothetical protein
MWAHDVDRPAYAELLGSIEQALPDATVVEDRRA